METQITLATERPESPKYLNRHGDAPSISTRADETSDSTLPYKQLVEILNDPHQNPLHRAVIENDHTTLRLIVEQHYMDINTSRVGDTGATPLHTALKCCAECNDAATKKLYLDTYMLLLELGAQKEEKNFWGEDINAYAKRKQINIDQLLTVYASEKKSASQMLVTPTSYAAEIANGNKSLEDDCKRLKIDTETSYIDIYHSALHIAVGCNNHDDIRRLLKEKSFDINRSRIGYSLATPLHNAVQHYAACTKDTEAQERYAKTIELLIQLGADWNEKNFWGEDVKKYAARKNVLTQLEKLFKEP